jgi:hypothetical protein
VVGLLAVVAVAAASPSRAGAVRAGAGGATDLAAPQATIRVPRDAPTIQAAVDRAAPGALVLVAPGVYRQTVLVTHPDVVIRGLDRNRTILEGGFRRQDGVAVTADGVAVENLTARDYLGNGFVWRGVDGYRGSYLTAFRVGEYGLYASSSQHGQFDHSYASGAVEGGLYIGACNPCHALVTDDVAEHNGVGFLATNASGDVLVARSRWRRNRVGIAATSSDLEPLPPQDGLVIAGNEVTGGRPTDARRAAELDPLVGTGVALIGTLDDVVTRNRVDAAPRFGIVVTPDPGLEGRPRPSRRNRVQANVVRHSGTADLVLAAASPDAGNCFARNEFRTSAPTDLERAAPCEGAASADLSAGALAAGRLFESRSRAPGPSYRQTPDAPREPGLPDAAGAPARPATAQPSTRVDPATVAIPAPSR